MDAWVRRYSRMRAGKGTQRFPKGEDGGSGLGVTRLVLRVMSGQSFHLSSLLCKMGLISPPSNAVGFQLHKSMEIVLYIVLGQNKREQMSPSP